MGIAGAGNSGTLISTLFGPRLAEMYGWHAVMGLALIPLSLVFLFFIFTAKDAPNQPAPQPLRSYFSVFQVKTTWFFCLLYAITFGGFVALSFLKLFSLWTNMRFQEIHAGDFGTLRGGGNFFRPVGGFDCR